MDTDTPISKESYDAALCAAGCVISAVDNIMQRNCKKAFCIVRPPGHHAGVFGAVASQIDPKIENNGFCIFNNIAVGASYAKHVYRDSITKIAILDFDVHHGNGT